MIDKTLMEINNGVRNAPMNNRNTQQNHHENNNASSGNNANDQFDAIHHRFRENLESNRKIVCLSCKGEFVANSQADICSHYATERHLEHFRLCLYCQGKVHRYTDENNRVELYHNCARSKRNLDQ